MLSLLDEKEILLKIDRCQDISSLEAIRVTLLGKNGTITKALQDIRNVAVDERKQISQHLNSLKDLTLDKIASKRYALENELIVEKIQSEKVDITLPAVRKKIGRLHPLTKVFQEVVDIFVSQGFALAQGQDIETEHFNFTALNMPESHPARQMHDTFYIDEKNIDSKFGKHLLRTHTSPVQIHSMLKWGAPLKVLAPGRVFRCDYDATHSPMFHQAEVLVLDKDIHFGHMKWCITDFCRKFFGVFDLPMRIRPGYFPFTEPSAEVDIPYYLRDGRIIIGQHPTNSGENKWLEIAGCGMVHPEVLRHANVDAKKYQGFAMGWGLDRLAALKYGISDIRGFFEGDSDWIERHGFSSFF